MSSIIQHKFTIINYFVKSSIFFFTHKIKKKKFFFQKYYKNIFVFYACYHIHTYEKCIPNSYSACNSNGCFNHFS